MGVEGRPDLPSSSLKQGYLECQRAWSKLSASSHQQALARSSQTAGRGASSVPAEPATGHLLLPGCVTRARSPKAHAITGDSG